MSGTRSLAIAAVFFAIALGVPAYYVFIKKRAAASLDDLIAERFKTPRACPLAKLDVPQGGHITCQIAYEDSEDAKTLLVLGMWDRGTVRVPQGLADVQQKVAGVFRTGTDDAWLARMRALPDVIVATAAPGGGLVMWKGLPDRAGVLAHLEASR